MSHYNSVGIEIKSVEGILAALAELKLKPIVVDKPVALKGYEGDKREQLAHIVVPGRTYDYGLTSVSNDLGFYREDDGRYTMHVSEYDSGMLHRRFSRPFGVAFKQAYAMAMAKQALPGLNLTSQSVAADGTVTGSFTIEVPDQVVSVGI